MTEPDILRLPEILVAGWYRESTPGQYVSDLRELWSQAQDHLPTIPNALLERTLVVTSDWFDDATPMSILFGAEVPVEPETTKVVTRSIPATTYAVFQFHGRLPRVSEDWDAIWHRLDQGDLVWPKNYSIRRYHHQSGIADICLPLDPASDAAV